MEDSESLDACIHTDEEFLGKAIKPIESHAQEIGKDSKLAKLFSSSVKSKIKRYFLAFFSIVLNDQILEKCDQVLFETVLRRPSGTDLKAP